MVDKDSDNSRKQVADQIGESDDFVLPIAPPTAPKPSKSRSAISTASGIPPEPPPLDSCHHPHNIHRGGSGDGPLPVHGSTKSKTVENLGGSSHATGSSNIERASSSSLVAGLIFTVVFLLLVVVIQFNHTPKPVATPFAPSLEYEGELLKARAETETSRSELAQLEGTIRGREEHLAASQDAAERKIARLVEDNRRLEEQNLELSAETSRLRERLLTATRSTKVSESLPPVQKTPAVQQDGKAYRVAGLRDGDTVNVRTGPGVTYSIVIALQNGVKVTATGPVVMNGPDAWLPCIITLNRVDSATGINRTWQQKCWINTFFIEPIEN